MAKPKLSFLATIPQMKSAIMAGSDEMQVKFEIPGSEKQNAVGLLALTGKVLRITVEVDESLRQKKPRNSDPFD